MARATAAGLPIGRAHELEPTCMVNDIPSDLLASRIINAAGTLTRLSGARVSTAVAAAMSQAAQSSFDMWALQAAASARIAMVTTGRLRSPVPS